MQSQGGLFAITFLTVLSILLNYNFVVAIRAKVTWYMFVAGYFAFSLQTLFIFGLGVSAKLSEESDAFLAQLKVSLAQLRGRSYRKRGVREVSAVPGIAFPASFGQFTLFYMSQSLTTWVVGIIQEYTITLMLSKG